MVRKWLCATCVGFTDGRMSWEILIVRDCQFGESANGEWEHSVLTCSYMLPSTHTEVQISFHWHWLRKPSEHRHFQQKELGKNDNKKIQSTDILQNETVKINLVDFKSLDPNVVIFTPHCFQTIFTNLSLFGLCDEIAVFKNCFILKGRKSLLLCANVIVAFFSS